MKKYLSIILAICILLTNISVTGFASNANPTVTFSVDLAYVGTHTIGTKYYENVVQLDLYLSGLEEGDKINAIEPLKLNFDADKATGGLVNSTDGKALTKVTSEATADNPCGKQKQGVIGDGFVSFEITNVTNINKGMCITGTGNKLHLLTGYIQITDADVINKKAPLDITIDTSAFAVIYRDLDLNAVTAQYDWSFESETLTFDLREDMNVYAEDKTVTYDGQEHMIEVSGAPAGSTITYTCNGEPFTGAKDVGTYEITANVTCDGYKPYTVTKTLIIEQTESVANGTCGENLTWTLNEYGTLTITGTGDMYSDSNWRDNSSIRKVIIGDGVTSISSDAFRECSYLTSVTIGNSVTTIGNSAFRETSLTNVIIGNSVRSIGYDAFRECFDLTNVIIGDNVTSIGNSAFFDCFNLENVTIGNNVTDIEAFAFCRCEHIVNIVLPESVTNIGVGAFEYCTSLNSITIPEGVTTIDSSTFNTCVNLTAINIPSTVTSIGSSAFYECFNLKNANYNGDFEGWSKISINSYGNEYLTNAKINFKYYFINDDFNSDGELHGWVMGPKHPSTTVGSVTQSTLDDGTGVMLISRTDTTGSGSYSAELRVDRDFDDIPLDGNKIVIEARMKTVSGTGQSYLRFNAPSETNAKWVLDTYDPCFHWTGWNGGILAELNPSASSIRYKSGAGTMSDALANIGGNNTWANVKMVIDGTDGTLNDYTFSVWSDGNEANATTKTGSLAEISIGADMYDPDYEKETGNTKSAYEMFKTLTFSLRNQNNLCVDYIRGYYEPDYVNAVASIISDTTNVSADAPIVIQFDTDTYVSSLPEEAFEIVGVDADLMYDLATNTVTLVPKKPLEQGRSYTVVINKDILKEKAGIVLSGENYFEINVEFDDEDIAYRYIFNDTFDDGTTCGWEAGAGNEVILTPVTLETGEKVLKAEMPVINTAPTWAANGEQSTVTKALENAVAFTGDNLIKIKARVKNAAVNDTYMIKVNRPNAVSQGLPLSCAGTLSYMVAGFDAGKPGFGIGLSAANAKYKSFEAFANKADGTVFDYTDVDLTNTWIDYTVVINGATNEQSVTASFEYNGETVTLYSTSKSTFIQPADAYTCAGREGETTFAGFERLTFASKDSTDGATLYIDAVSVENLSPIDSSPEAYNVTVSGVVTEGYTLNGSYSFYQAEGKSDASTVQWVYCDTEDGEYIPIPGATSINYTVEAQYADKYIKFAVTPKTDDGMVGTTVYSDFITMARVPVASNVTIIGDFNVGGSIKAEFDFYDPNGDAQGAHIYNWMIDGVVVHTGETLTLTEAMIGKYIKVGVTPVSANAPTDGTEVWSDAVAGPSYPLASNVSVSKEDGRLVGHYTYSHPHGTKEKDSVYAWYVDGAVVSNNIDYTPNFEGTKIVTFSVTPKSEGNPSTGQTVSVSISMGNARPSTGSSTGGFVGGGSSGGGGGSSEQFMKYFASDNFASGTDDWIVGESGEGFLATITTVDDAYATDGKALKITFPGKGAKHEKGDKYAVYGSVTKQGIGNGTEFSTNKELTIKARVKKIDSAMTFELKGNRPNTVEQVGHDFEWNCHYNLLEQKADAGGVGLTSDSVLTVGSYGSNFWGYHASSVTSGSKVDLTGKWVEYTIKFKPEDQKYYVTIKYTDTDGTDRILTENQVGYMRACKPELLKEYGDDFAYDKSIRQYFGGLKSVTFTSRTAGDIYVDYVEVYGERDYVNATASVASTVSPTGSVVVSFTGENDAKVPAFPAGAVTIDGAECDVIPDVQAQTVTFKPKSRLTPGTELTVNVNSTLFDSDEGVNITGQTSFPVHVEYVSATAELISDSVISADGSVTVKFTSTEPMTSFVDGLVTIEGVECDYTSDVNEQTITLTPKAPLDPGETYTVKIDTELLKTSEGIILSGPSVFNFSALAYLNVCDVKLDKVPKPGTTVSVSYQYSGTNIEGEHVYQWQTSASFEGPWVNLAEGTENSYTFDDSLTHGCYVRALMTPYDSMGNQGETVATEPVVYKSLPIEDEDGNKFRKYYINDDYNEAGNVGNWKKGNTSQSYQTITVSQETLNEDGENVGALKFYGNYATGVSATQPAMINEFDKVKFEEGSKYVIETRVKITGGINESTAKEGSDVSFKFNRPNDPKYLVENSYINYRGWNVGTLFKIKNGDASPGITYKRYAYSDSVFASGDYTDKWANIKIEIDGATALNEQKYTIYVLDDAGAVIATNTGLLKEYNNAAYDVYSYVDRGEITKTKYEDIRSFSFVLRNYSETVYVDYFKFYELRDVATATVSMINESVIRPKDSVTIEFTGSNPIKNFPEGLVTIDGVETVMTQDIEKQTVTVTPVSELEMGQEYTVRVNSGILGNTEGYIIQGEKKFTVNVSPVNVYDVKVYGRVIPGTTMSAEYSYEALEAEGTHLYQWQKSTDGITWEDITGETNDTYEVTQDDYDSKYYIRVCIIPCDIDGNRGILTESEVVIPEIAPAISNVVIDAPSTPFVGTYIGVKYDYCDINGDIESGTIVEWFTSTDGISNWQKLSTGEKYYITENDLGLYIKCTITPKSNSMCESIGVTVESEAIGPVVDIISDTNLLINSDFERGDLVGWSNNYGIIEIAGAEGARTGNYGVHLMPRESIQASWVQTVNGITPGKRYILGGWVKKSSSEAVYITGFLPYSWSGLSRVGEHYGCDVGDDWVQTVGAFQATYDTAKVCFVSFATLNADAYLDDLYFGELLITDIETYDTEPITIPVDGTVKVPVTSGKILNQLGTTHGLTDERVIINIPDGVKGITTDGYNIIVDNSAIAGKYTIELYCIPSYDSPAQENFYKCVDIELSAGSNTRPEIRNLVISGNVAVGETLTASYEFYQVEGKPDSSVYQWKYSDQQYGEYKSIIGANLLSFTVTDEYADKFIRLYVTPVTDDGTTGKRVYSNVLAADKVNEVINLGITGDFNVGSTLTGVYELVNTDLNNDVSFEWYTSASKDGMYHLAAKTDEPVLVLTEKFIDKYIKFSVSYTSDDGTVHKYYSDAYFGPSAPIITNVVFNTYMGGYKWEPICSVYHAHGAEILDIKYEWRVDGELVSTQREFLVDYFDETKTVELTVTPVADSNPAYGEPVTITMDLKGRTMKYTGKCGKNVNWEFDDSGILTISGTGAMTDYPSGQAPWSTLPVEYVVIENGITHIGDNAFRHLTCEFSELPDSLETIGTSAFCGISSLASIVIPENVKVIGDWAFNNCPNLVYVIIPEGLESIGDGAFAHCTSLTFVKPADLVNVGIGVIIPDSVTDIGYSAFQNCPSISDVKLSKNLEAINYYTFYGCDLTNIFIPESVTLIGYGALTSDYNEVVVAYGGDEAQWNSNVYIEDGNSALTDGNIHFCPLQIKYDFNYAGKESEFWNASENSQTYIGTLIPERNGYMFKGWSLTPYLSDELYQHGDIINTTNEDITLYAIWEKCNIDVYASGNTYTVSISSLPESCEIIFAAYNENELAYFDSYTYDNSSSVEFNFDGVYDKVKVMVWKSLSNPKPLTDVVEINNSANISSEQNLAIVTDVKTILNENDERVFQLSFLQGGEEKTLATTEKITSVERFDIGDVFEYGVAENGVINNVFNHSSVLSFKNSALDQSWNEYNSSKVQYAFGAVYGKQASRRIISVVKYEPDSVKPIVDVTSIGRNYIPEDAVITVIDCAKSNTEANKVVLGSFGDIQSTVWINSITVDESSDYAVFIKYCQEEIIDVVVYKNFANFVQKNC